MAGGEDEDVDAAAVRWLMLGAVGRCCIRVLMAAGMRVMGGARTGTAASTASVGRRPLRLLLVAGGDVAAAAPPDEYVGCGRCCGDGRWQLTAGYWALANADGEVDDVDGATTTTAAEAGGYGGRRWCGGYNWWS